MKYMGICFTLFFIFITSASAQISEKLHIFVTSGSSVPMESFLMNEFNKKNNVGKVDVSNFKEYWNAGLNLGGGLEFKLFRHVQLMAAFSYSHFPANDNKFRSDWETLYRNLGQNTGIEFTIVEFNVYRGSTNIYTVSIGAKASFPVRFLTPYLTGGGGYMRINLEPIEFSSLVDPLEYNASFSYRIPGETSNSLMGYGGAGVFFNLSKNIRPFVEANYLIGFTDPDNTIFYSYRAGLNFGFH